MEYKQGDRWLRRIRALERQIQEEKWVLEALYTCVGLQGISYDRVSVMTSPENKFEKIMAEIDEHKTKVEELQIKKAETIHEISSRINNLGECPERTILYGYYIGGSDMETLSEDLGYELSWCYRLRRKGIEAL
ncbi:MAG: hypothetical protein J5725_13215 [Bacteroidales bacterium]|nr:hypothetical protein [Bacteroidales bacterium]